MPVSRSPQPLGSMLSGAIVLIKRFLCVDGTSAKILLQVSKGRRGGKERMVTDRLSVLLEKWNPPPEELFVIKENKNTEVKPMLAQK